PVHGGQPVGLPLVTQSEGLQAAAELHGGGEELISLGFTVRLPHAVAPAVLPADLQSANGVAEDPELALDRRLVETVEQVPRPFQPRGRKEFRDALSTARPQVAGAGAGGEHRDISSHQVPAFERDQLRDAWPRLDRHPEMIEEAVAVQGVAEEEGVEALDQQ